MALDVLFNYVSLSDLTLQLPRGNTTVACLYICACGEAFNGPNWNNSGVTSRACPYMRCPKFSPHPNVF